MTRWVSNNNATAAAQRAVAMVTLVDLNFSSGAIFLHDGFGTLSANGNTYQGVGDYGSIDAVDESTESIAKTVTLKLSGVPGALVTDAITTDYQGQQVTIWIGLFDPNALTFIDVPEVVWQGRMDTMGITLGQGKSEIEMRCEHRLNREPRVARYTDEDQQIAFPGDTFFNLTWQIPLLIASWGAVTVQHPKNIPPTGRYGGGTTGRSGGGPGRSSGNQY